jgi:GxxExxY protein
MGIEMHNLDLRYQSEVPLPIVYRGEKVSDEGFRMDFLVEDTIIVELKSVNKIRPNNNSL